MLTLFAPYAQVTTTTFNPKKIAWQGVILVIKNQKFSQLQTTRKIIMESLPLQMTRKEPLINYSI